MKNKKMTTSKFDYFKCLVRLLFVFILSRSSVFAQTTQQDVAEFIANTFLTDSIIGTFNCEEEVWLSDNYFGNTDTLKSWFDNTEVITPYNKTWVGMIDGNPTAHWPHPCLWVVVDDSLQNFEIFEMNYPPTVFSSNGTKDHLSCANDLLNCDCFQVTEPPVDTAIVAPPTVDDDCLYAVLFSCGDQFHRSNKEIGFYYDIKNVYNKLRNAGYKEDNIFVYYKDGTEDIDGHLPVGDWAPDPEALDLDGDGDPDITGNVEDAPARIEELCDDTNMHDNFLFIYATTHGWREMGPAHPDPTIQSKGRLKLRDVNGNGRSDMGEFYTEEDLRTDVKENTFCRVTVMLQACKTGSFTDIHNSTDIDNVSVYAASLPHECSWFWPTGSEFTNFFFEKNIKTHATIDLFNHALANMVLSAPTKSNHPLVLSNYRLNHCCPDYGDAPDNGEICLGVARNYQTFDANAGPLYWEYEQQKFGFEADSEIDGQPNCPADGDDANPVFVLEGPPPMVVVKPDDEDGIHFVPGGVNIDVTIVRPGENEYRIDGWFDLNNDGVFQHGGNGDEHKVEIITMLEPGLHNFIEDLDFDGEDFYSRFRLTYGVDPAIEITPYYEYTAADSISHGEVEDYSPAWKDYGDAPDDGQICFGVPRNYQTTLLNDGPRYREFELQKLGQLADPELDGQPDCLAVGDDNNPAVDDDEDGIHFVDGGVNIHVNIFRPGANKYLIRAWFDVNNNGVFDHPAERFISRVDTLDVGFHTFFEALPFDGEDYYSRFRLTYGVDPIVDIKPYSEYLAGDSISHGEVEDYAPLESPGFNKIPQALEMYPGEPFQYVFEVHNPCPHPITDVTVIDQLPPNLQFMGDDFGGTFSNGTYIADIGIVNPQEIITIMIEVLLDPNHDALAEPMIYNNGELHYTEGIPVISQTCVPVLPGEQIGCCYRCEGNQAVFNFNYTMQECIDDPEYTWVNIPCDQLPNPCIGSIGCTDPNACNYNPNATEDDGSCVLPPVCNGDPCLGDIETLDFSSCTCTIVKPQVLGCTNPAACNYNPAANCSDESCDFGEPACADPCNPVFGCTDPTACNYDADACADNGSCQASPPIIDSIFTINPTCDESNGEIIIFASGNTTELFYTIDDDNGFFETNQTGIFTNLDWNLLQELGGPIQPVCDWIIQVEDENGCTISDSVIWTDQGNPAITEISTIPNCNGASISITASSSSDLIYTVENGQGDIQTNTTGLFQQVYWAIYEDGLTCTANIQVEDSNGCIDEVTIEVAVLVCGCIDPCAPNYDPNATVADGSCEPYDTTCNADCTAGPFGGTWDAASCSCVNETEPILGCTDAVACNYNPDANCSDESCDFGEPACADPCNTVFGCIDPLALNFDATANCDDGSCEYGCCVACLNGELIYEDSNNEADCLTNPGFAWVEMSCEEVPDYYWCECNDIIPLKAGWNLISLDVSPYEPAVDVLLSTLTPGNLITAVGFDNGAIVYDPSLPSFLNTFNTFEDGYGYWVKVDFADTLEVVGECLPDTFRRTFDADWNLIAYPPQISSTPAEYFEDEIAEGSLAYVASYNEGVHFFDPAIPTFLNTLDSLRNGFGYWIKLHYAVPNKKGQGFDTNVFSFITGTNNLPEGSTINIQTANGYKVGEIKVLKDNYLSITPIYGDDLTTTSKQEGLAIGEPLYFSYNDQLSDVNTTFKGDMSVEKMELLFEQSASFTINPNPNTGSFQIELTKPINNGFVEVISAAGKKYFHSEVTDNATLLLVNLKNAKAGVYIVKVSDEKNVEIQKVIIH